MNPSRSAMVKLSEWSVLLLVLFSILWKGGKTIETTWLLVFVSVCAVLIGWWQQMREEKETGRQFRNERREIPIVVCMPAVLFLLSTILSFFFSSTKNYGLDEVLREGVLVLLFFWTMRKSAVNDNEKNFAEKLFIVISIGAFFACFIGFAVYFYQPVTRFVGTFFDYRFHTDYWPNAWAEFLLLAWPLGFFCVRRAKSSVPFVLVGMAIGCLFLSFSRGALLAFGCQIALLLLLRFVDLFHDHKRTDGPTLSHSAFRIGVRIALVVIVSLLTFSVANALRSKIYNVESITQKATFTAEEGTSSIDERSAFWSQSFALSLEKPLVGWGPYSFRFIQPRLETGVFQTADHPHNVFLKLAMERGWPAAFLFAVVTLAVLGMTLFSLLRRTLGPSSGLALSAMLACGGVLIHNLIDYNLQFVGIALPFWMLLGVQAGLQMKNGASAAYRNVLCTVEVTLAMAFFIVAASEGRFLLLSSLARHAEAQGKTDEALSWYESSVGEVFSRDLHLSRAHLSILKGEEEAAAKALDEYFKANGEDARAWQVKGDLAFRTKKYDDALRAYNEALYRGRYNTLSILRGLLETIHEKHDTSLLASRKSEFEKLMNDYADAMMMNAHFIDLSANVEDFAAVVKLLERLYPVDARKFRDLGDQVAKHAAEERLKSAARPPGYLW